MSCIPIRIFHAFISGAVAALLLSLGILYLHENVFAKTATFHGNGWGDQPAPSAAVPPAPYPITSTDSDGDGIPNTWETANAHNPNSRKDASADFDFDGLTAKQEYDLSVESNGQYGKPLGTYELATIPDPPDYTTLSSVTLLETAKNGMTLVRVLGVRTDSSTSSNRIYVYSPITGQWRWVSPPAGVSLTTVLNVTDVNSRGQVVGYTTTGGNKGFIWTPSSTNTTGGESIRFFINPTSTTPTSAFPRRISDTGHLLYTTSSPTGTDLKAADPNQIPINPITNSWTSPTYVDVNDFGEYVGTIVNPVTYLRHTFLAMPGGYFYLSAPTTDDLMDNGVLPYWPDVDEASIEWTPIPTFTYPDDYFDENNDPVDPYEPYQSYNANGPAGLVEYGTALDGEALFRRNITTGLIYWNEWNPPPPDGGRSWIAVSPTGTTPAALNDWGEFAGAFSYTFANETVYHDTNSGEPFHSYYENTTPGAFFFNSDYHFITSATSIVGMSNDPQLLLSSDGVRALYVWSDSVIAPIGKLIPNNFTPTKTKICDNGLLVFQKAIKILQTLTPADDTDGDGLPDDWEVFYGFNPNFKDAYADPDGDGTNNLGEFYLRTDPNRAPVYDPNGNLIDTRPGIDTDGDGIPNSWECVNGLDYTNPSDAALDFDRDGYTNLQEFRLNTDPNGRPFYRIRQIGPFAETLSVSMAPAQLGDNTLSPPPAGAVVSDSFYFNAGVGIQPQRPAVWNVQKGAEEGSYTTYTASPAGVTTPLAMAPVAQSVSGASLAISTAAGPNKMIYYWSSPSAAPIALLGSYASNNIASMSNVQMSPGGKYVAGYRVLESTGVTQRMVWRMPEGGVTYAPLALPDPAGATISSSAPLYVNDYGYIVTNATIAGVSRGVRWFVKPSYTITATVLSNLPDAVSATVSGISNQAAPTLAGTSTTNTSQLRATIWASGSVVDLGTLTGGNSSTASAISPTGLVGGVSQVLDGSTVKNQPFVAAFDSATSLWKMKAVGVPGSNFLVQTINDTGEVLGLDYQVTPVTRTVPTLWRYGKAYALDNLLPASSGCLFTGVVSMNQHGSLLVEASKNGAKTYLLLTPDQDTDGDGFPDAYETRSDFNPFVKNDPALDSDSDGLSDMDEYRNGTSVRVTDSDGDGMSDGWEVSWGFQPMDPADAALDPDGDGVDNLREFQIGTPPTGIYRADIRVSSASAHIPELVSVGENGAIIYKRALFQDTNTAPDGSWTVTSGDKYWFFPRQLQYPADEPLPLRQLGFTYGYNNLNAQVYMDTHTLNYGVDPDSNDVNGSFSKTFQTFNGTVWVTSPVKETLLSTNASLQGSGTATWVSWPQVEGLLHTPPDEVAPILGAGESLDPFAQLRSPSGNLRVHVAQPGGERYMLDGRGGSIRKLPSTLPTNLSLWKLNNSGDLVSLARTQVAATEWVPAYYSGAVTWCKDGVISTFPVPLAPGISVNALVALSDSATIVLEASELTSQGVAMKAFYLFDLNSKVLSPITRPGLGTETITSISAANDRMLGSGPKPFQIAADGSCLPLESLRIRTGPATTAPLKTLYANPLTPNHVNKDGLITLTTTDALSDQVILQLVPENDGDNDGVPDDWERSVIDQLNASRPVGATEPPISTDVSLFDPNADNDGDGKTLKQEWDDGTSDGTEDNIRTLLKVPNNPKDRDKDGLLNADDADPDDRTVDWMKTSEPVYVLRDLGIMMPGAIVEDLSAGGDVLTSYQDTSGENPVTILRTYSSETGGITELSAALGSRWQTKSTPRYEVEQWSVRRALAGSRPLLTRGKGKEPDTEYGFYDEADPDFVLDHEALLRESYEFTYDTVVRDNAGGLEQVSTLSLFDLEGDNAVGADENLKPDDTQYNYLFCDTAYGQAVLPSSRPSIYWAYYGYIDMDFDGNVLAGVLSSQYDGSFFWEKHPNGNSYNNPQFIDGYGKSTATVSQTIPTFVNSSGLSVPAQTIERHLVPTSKGLFVAQKGGRFTLCPSATAEMGELTYFDPLPQVTSDGCVAVNVSGTPFMWVNGKWNRLSDFVMGNPQFGKMHRMQENGIVAVEIPQTSGEPHMGVLIPIDVSQEIGSGSPDALEPLNPPYMREVKLSGVQKTEAKPEEGAEIDLPGEDTSVDALNRRLYHDTSIAYVDVPASDLDLAIKLSVDNSPVAIPSLTNLAAGGSGSISEKAMQTVMTRAVAESARQKMGRFGLGWNSNIDAKVTCKPMFAKKPKQKPGKYVTPRPGNDSSGQIFTGYDVRVHDENGREYRFYSSSLQTFTSDGMEVKDVAGFQTSLTRTGNVLSLNRKYGTSTKYALTSSPPVTPDGLNDPNSLWNLPQTYTAVLTGFVDRYGNSVGLSQTSSNPATGSSVSQLFASGRTGLQLSIETSVLSSPDKVNKFSLVTSITNPRGFKVKLAYNWVECWGALLPVLSNVIQPDGTRTRYGYGTRSENAGQGGATSQSIWGSRVQTQASQPQGATAIERATKKEDADEDYGMDEGMMTFFHLNLASVTDPAGKITSIQWEKDVRYDTTIMWQKCKADITHYSGTLQGYLNGFRSGAETFQKDREWKKIDKYMAKHNAGKFAEGMYVTQSRGVPDVVKAVTISANDGSIPLGFTIQQARQTPPTPQPASSLVGSQVAALLNQSPDVAGGAETPITGDRISKIETFVTDFGGNQTTYRFSDFHTLRAELPQGHPGRVIVDRTNPLPEPNEKLFWSMSLSKGVGYRSLECITNKPEGGTAKATYQFDPQANYALAKTTDINGNITEYGHTDSLSTRKFTFPLKIVGGSGQPGTEEALTKYDDPNTEIKKTPSGTILTSKTFSYDPATRFMTSEVDANGNETVYTHDTLGRVTDEYSYSGTAASGTLVAQKSMEFHLTFKNFVTKETTKSLPSSGKPTWETDLVTTFVPNGAGFVWKTTVDPTGLALLTEKTYDNGGNVLTSKDPKTYVTTFTYDNVGRLATTTYHDQTLRTYGYDSGGRKVRETDENGHAMLWKYDGFGRVVKTATDMNGNLKMDAADVITSTTYNKVGQPLTTTDAMGKVTQYGYDAWYRLISTTDPLGGVTTCDYSGANSGTGLANDPKWMPTRVRDARGFITENQYNNLYRAVSVKKEYQLPLNPPVPITRTLGLCYQAETVYDNNGNATLESTICPGRATRVNKAFYDALDRPYLVTSGFGSALASSTRTLYTSTGFAWKTIAFDGNSLLQRESVTEFDAAGRTVKSTGPAPATGGITTGVSAVTETHYDKNSNVDYTIDPLGNRTDYEYDLRNRKTKTLAPAATDWSVAGNPSVRAQVVTTYDGVGNVRTVTDHYGTVTETIYDAANRTIQTIAAKDRTEQAVTDTVYDANNNVVLVTDANNNKTRNFYDAANRLIGTAVNPVTGNPSSSLTSPATDDIVVANVYDAGGNLVRVADGAAAKTFSGSTWSFTLTTGHVTGFTYDGLGRKLTTTWDVGSSVAKTDTSIYDALHQTERLDAKQKQTLYTYDDLGRLDQVTYVNRTVDNRNYHYKGGSGTNSGPGALDSVTHPNAGNTLRNLAYTHDRLDQVTAESSAGVTHQYVYDRAANRVLVSYGNTSRKVVSKFDTNNRLASAIETTAAVADPLTYTAQSGDRTTIYRYDALGRAVRLEMPNGTATAKTFDRLGRVILMNTLNGAGTVISGYNYTGGYDKMGNVMAFLETSSTLPARSMVNLYDKTYRLTKESDNTSGDVFYYYDKACNRTGKSVGGVYHTYNFGTPDVSYNTNQLRGVIKSTNPSVWAVYFTYDNNGNRLTRVENGQTDSLDYDYDNRLVSLTKNTGSTALGSYAYQYDSRTRRVWRDEPGTNDAALSFSGGLSVQEYPSAPTTGSVPAVETLRGSDLGGGIGGVLYTLRGGTASFDSYNSRGDVVSQTNSSGGVQWQASYEAFGTRKTQSAAPNLDRQRANTKDEDPTGLLNEGMRYRDLETGVFITRDPLGFVDGPNVYAYVQQNPWTSFDPDGLKKIDDYSKKIYRLKKEKTAAMQAAMKRGVSGRALFGVHRRFEMEISAAQNAILEIADTARQILKYTDAEVDPMTLDDEWADYKSLRTINFWHSLNPEAEAGTEFAKGNYKSGAKRLAIDMAVGVALQGGGGVLLKAMRAEATVVEGVTANTVNSTRALPAILDEPLVAGQHTLDAAIENLPALRRVRFSAKPQFEGGLEPLGEARRFSAIDGEIAIGTRAFSSNNQLAATLVHEEAHLRFYSRLRLNGSNSGAGRIGLAGEENYVRAVEARFLRMKGLTCE